MSKKKLLKLIQKENIRREIINPVYPICFKSKHPNRSPSIDYYFFKSRNFSSVLSGEFGFLAAISEIWPIGEFRVSWYSKRWCYFRLFSKCNNIHSRSNRNLISDGSKITFKINYDSLTIEGAKRCGRLHNLITRLQFKKGFIQFDQTRTYYQQSSVDGHRLTVPEDKFWVRVSRKPLPSYFYGTKKWLDWPLAMLN